ncbi:MAG TPA: hypothetical protein VKE69_00590 [Planctomycetota bacterium]|nr:hypothetical protein [Planctomycetota bacterium]
MKRALLGAAIGLAATALASLLFWMRDLDSVALGVAIGGAAGSLIAAASAGSQVALVHLLPRSNASLAAMVAGFAAKLLALAVGILVLWRPGAPADAVAFAIALVAASLVTTGVILPALLPRRTSPRTPTRTP